MKVALLTNIISPHRIPLSVELASIVGAENYRYYYTEPLHAERARMGWGGDAKYKWCVPFDKEKNNVEFVDVLISGNRVWDIFERRASRGLLSIYTSERWFKPPVGLLRLLLPSYFRMARKFVRMLSGAKRVYYLPQGIHAARDMARLCGLFAGDLRCLFRSPKLEFDRYPCGRTWVTQRREDTKAQRTYCLDKMRMWGYFVAPSEFGIKSSVLTRNSQLATPNSQLSTQLTQSQLTTHNSLKVLWVGRLLKWKRVDTIIRAVGELSNSNSNLQLTLDIYGTGPEESKLKKLAAKYGDIINFYPPVPIDEVRKLMRSHDVYVLSSNAYEGWGAVINEALEERMHVMGTYEAGSSGTMLPVDWLFNVGDWRSLSQMICRCAQTKIPAGVIAAWGVANAAHRFMETVISLRM